ncbi:hypothetical protein BKA66DRAFT_571262 [Pyrenochaeta sp. MPI-SDFR-AT-0127]|nr:hypothetical protein BKA66DRAFT_571262 [Pyrenochaeta sp. MPI-SDFR-AT-0127]
MQQNTKSDQKASIAENAVGLEQILAQHGRVESKSKQSVQNGFNLSAPQSAGIKKPKQKRPFSGRRKVSDTSSCKRIGQNTNQHAVPASNFIKPQINKSRRVDKLLKQFSPLSTSSIKTEPGLEVNDNTSLKPLKPAIISDLKRNKRITKSDYAKRLAWEIFSLREHDRDDRGLNAMIKSGLRESEMEKDLMGHQNKLPEWRKLRTGKFAMERLMEDTGKGTTST